MERLTRDLFVRQSGALGLAAAATLGWPLGLRASTAAAPRDTISAGGGAVVRLGHLDPYATNPVPSQAQQVGIEVALENANRKNSRIKYVLSNADDHRNAAGGRAAARHLISEDNVDALIGCLSSTTALAVSETAQELGVVFLSCNHDTDTTGALAHRVTFRQTCSVNMLASAVGPALLNFGKKWQFVSSDGSTFGRDSQARLERILLAAGGTVVGNAVHPIGLGARHEDFAIFMKANVSLSSADVLVFCNYAQDTSTGVSVAVDLDLHKRMHIGGIVCESDIAENMPLDEIVGSTWGYIWGPDAGGRETLPLYHMLKRRAPVVSWRHYLGYMAAKNIIDVMNAVGTTDAQRVAHGFEDYRYDAAKAREAYFRACDHQAVQQAYAAQILPNLRRQSNREYFGISNSVSEELGAQTCANPDSVEAARVIASERIVSRPGHPAISLR